MNNASPARDNPAPAPQDWDLEEVVATTSSSSQTSRAGAVSTQSCEVLFMVSSCGCWAGKGRAG